MSQSRSCEDLSFTIIIPTRERSDTLFYTIKSALSVEYSNCQILVSDNASDDATREIVRSFSDPRLRYINTGRRVSMSENWDFALCHVNTDWVTVLGDDDGILPGSLKLVASMVSETGTRAVRSNGCSYSWPGISGSSYGLLRLSLGRGYVIRKSDRMLQQVLNGTRSYNELPMLYNGGFICFDVLREVKKRSGRFISSSIPDVYTAVAVSMILDSYVYSNEPLAINGASHHSNGTAACERFARKRSYDPVKKFWSENSIPLHDAICPISSNQLVTSIQAGVYESFMQAEVLGRPSAVWTCHDKQLKIILAAGGPHPQEINAWALLFTDKHGLIYPSRSILLLLKMKLSYFRMIRRLRLSLSYYFARGNGDFGLHNVESATQVASALKLVRPGLLHRICSRF